ncbi:MAG: hypothetical protein ACRCSF_02260 [Mycobacteriaceae bacterium]
MISGNGVTPTGTGPPGDCEAMRDRDHTLYLQLIASLLSEPPIPQRVITRV